MVGEVAVEVVFAELLGADPAVADRDEVALIVRRFLDSALGPSSTLANAADLIKDVQAGYPDPLGLGH